MTEFPKTLADAAVSDINLAEEEFRFQGQRLTEQRAEQIAAKVFNRSDNLIPGGKSLSGDTTHSPIVQARVPATVYARLRMIAERRNVSVSRLLREALIEVVERDEHHA